MQFYIHNNDILRNCIKHIQSLPLNGKFVISIQEKKNKRSLNQNDLWHAWVDLIAKEAGYSPKDMKDILKENILGMREIINPFTGNVKKVHYETKKLTKEQFSRLMTETQVRAFEYYSLTLPSPDGGYNDKIERGQ